MVGAHYKPFECGPYLLISKGAHHVVISKDGSCVHNHRKDGPTLYFVKVGHTVTITKGGATL